MIRIYILGAIRTLLKRKIDLFVNIIGMAFSLGSCFMLYFFLQDELSYDSFHERSDNIYQVRTSFMYGDNQYDWDMSGGALSGALTTEIPGVQLSTRVRDEGGNLFIYQNYDNYKSISDINTLFVDPSFLDIFNFELIVGNKSTVLSTPGNIILTKTLAAKFFEDQDPIGEILEYDSDEYKVAGIINDPINTHLNFDILVAMSSYAPFDDNNKWADFTFKTYFLTAANISETQIRSSIEIVEEKHFWPAIQRFDGYNMDFLKDNREVKGLYLRRLDEIHLKTGSNEVVFKILAIVGVLVAFIGIINFINLFTARYATKSKELGLRRMMGASNKDLFIQLLFETIICSLAAFSLAWISLVLSAPYLESVFNKSFLSAILNPQYIVAFALISVLFFGLIGGSIPYMFLVKANLLQFLGDSAKFKADRAGKAIRKILVVFQFTISSALIILSIVVIKQVNFILDKDLGYDPENIIVLKNANLLGDKKDTFKDELLKLSSVSNVSISMNIPNTGLSGTWGIAGPDNKKATFDWRTVDYGYIPTYGFEIIKGRNFSEDFASDSTAIIINKHGAKLLNISEDPIGKELTVNGKKATVIGVTEDFHFESLHSSIRGAALLLPNWDSWLQYISIKTTEANVAETLNSIESKWKAFFPNLPFEYSFLEDYQKTQYEKELTLKEVIRFFTALAFILACIGLFGFVNFTVESKFKEIGIRKVLGASISSVMVLITRQLMLLVIIGFAISTIPTWFLTNNWLSEFSYRIPLGISIFLLAILFILFISWLTIFFKCFRAATVNPIKSIKHE